MLKNNCVQEKWSKAIIALKSVCMLIEIFRWKKSGKMRKTLYLMRKSSCSQTCFASRLVFPFHEKGKQLSFSLDKYGPSSNEAEAIFLQDVTAVLHHLMAKQDKYLHECYSENLKLSNLQNVALVYSVVNMYDIGS